MRSKAPLFLLLSGVVVSVAVASGGCGSEDGSAFSNDGASSGSTSSSGSFGTSGGDGKGSTTPQVKALVFDPPTAALVVDGDAPKSVSFQLKATLPDDRVVDVTPEGLQFDRPDLAAAANGSPVTLTTTNAFGGVGKLHGIYGGVEAIAELTVKVERKEIGAGVTPTIVAALDAPGLATDPTVTALRYPYDKTVFPLGLTSPLVMWNTAAANDVYRLRLEQANYTYDLYAIVNAPGQLRVGQAMWDRITASNSGDPLKVTLSRYAVANSTAYRSTSAEWTIAPASLRGAIYYWTASKAAGDPNGDGHIARIQPGVGSAPHVMSTGIPNKPCMGCHAVSADGSTLAASVAEAPSGNPATYAYTNGWNDKRGWASFNLPDGAVRKQTAMNGSNLALTPDGKYAVFGGRMQTNAQRDAGQWQAGSKYMSLADTATGTIVVNSGLDDLQLASATRGLSMPAFSPDGKHLATVEFEPSSLNELRDNVLPKSTQILIFGFDQATLRFSAAPTRLPLAAYTPYQTKGIGYPSFTPDNRFVAFHVGNESTGCFNDGNGNCDDLVQHRGAIWFQNADGASAPQRLGALSDPPATSDREQSVEPTFNPIERGGYSWVVFTSMRDWGNKLTGTANNGKRRLWVAAINAQIGTVDPSHPPFYLEGQEDSPNMRGFWTLAACIATPPAGAPAGTGTCAAGFECCSGFCDRGVCVEPSKLACVGVGDACTTSAECCNAQNVSCINGRCTLNGVK